MRGLGLFLLVLASGCIYPEPPGYGTVQNITKLADGTGEWIQIKQPMDPDPKHLPVPRPERRRNLLLVVVDDFVQFDQGDDGKEQSINEKLVSIYHDPNIRLENVVWWMYAPRIQYSYKSVLRIYWNGLNKDSLVSALDAMEAKKEPYDAMFLV